MTPTWLLRRPPPPEPDTEPAPPPADPPDGDAPGGDAADRDAPERDAPGRDAGDAPDAADAKGVSYGRLRKVVLAGTAAVLVLGGCGFFYAAHQVRSAAPAQNRALTDTEATTRVAGDVGDALARIFSYTPDGTAAAERSARTVLDGRAARQYETLFARVRDDLTEQRVTLSTRAVRTGVIELEGDRARLLVFLDQTSHRGDGKGKGAAEATTAAAQLTVTARLDDDRWRIVDIKAR
ncbi:MULTISPECIES: nuclear transport factor 2 family protein [Streptomyces]|uniref:nuclear transport factor 2 family protein n=1 Tax=Streptomyces TaxID=1883 RepID=UPI00115171DC